MIFAWTIIIIIIIIIVVVIIIIVVVIVIIITIIFILSLLLLYYRKIGFQYKLVLLPKNKMLKLKGLNSQAKFWARDHNNGSL